MACDIEIDSKALYIETNPQSEQHKWTIYLRVCCLADLFGFLNYYANLTLIHKMLMSIPKRAFVQPYSQSVCVKIYFQSKSHPSTVTHPYTYDKQ